MERLMGMLDGALAPDGTVFRLALCALGAGGCAAVSMWVLLGWGRRDALDAVHSWGAWGARAIESLAARLAGAARLLGLGLGGGSAGDGRAGMGDVSEMVDIVRLGLQAGLSFDASLGLYCEGRAGELSSQLARARLSWQTGLATREEALLGAARTLGLKPLESFSIAVAQALELGAPLAGTLEGQSREMRAAHRANVERQIERAPVKLLIPTGTLILPALLLSIVGPLVAAGGLM